MTELPIHHPMAAAYVDLNDMTVLLNSGEVLPITNLIDENGDLCDADTAVVAVAGSDTRGWWTVPIPTEKPVLN